MTLVRVASALIFAVLTVFAGIQWFHAITQPTHEFVLWYAAALTFGNEAINSLEKVLR